MKITLKDGSVKEYSSPMSIIDIAKDLSEGLARVACVGEVDGEVKDLRTVIDKDCKLSILTFDDEAGKKAYRHTASHVMAEAVKRLYPDDRGYGQGGRDFGILKKCRHPYPGLS